MSSLRNTIVHSRIPIATPLVLVTGGRAISVVSSHRLDRFSLPFPAFPGFRSIPRLFSILFPYLLVSFQFSELTYCRLTIRRQRHRKYGLDGVDGSRFVGLSRERGRGRGAAMATIADFRATFLFLRSVCPSFPSKLVTSPTSLRRPSTTRPNSPSLRLNKPGCSLSFYPSYLTHPRARVRTQLHPAYTRCAIRSTAVL